MIAFHISTICISFFILLAFIVVYRPRPCVFFLCIAIESCDIHFPVDLVFLSRCWFSKTSFDTINTTIFSISRRLFVVHSRWSNYFRLAHTRVRFSWIDFPIEHSFFTFHFETTQSTAKTKELVWVATFYTWLFAGQLQLHR